MALADLTLANIRTRIRDRLIEQDTNTFTNAMLNQLINEGQEEFVRKTKCLKSRADTPSVDGAPEYQLPTDFLDMHEVHYGDGANEKEIFYADRQTLRDNFSVTWWRLEGTPQWYHVRDDLITLVPMPGTNGIQIRVWYFQRPDLLVNDSDKPMIPDEYQRALIYYALKETALSDKDRRAAHWEAKWQETLKGCRSDFTGRQLGGKRPYMATPAGLENAL